MGGGASSRNTLHVSLILPWVLAVALLCLIPRVGLWLAYEPLVAPDSGSYTDLAHRIGTWDFQGFNGARTPGYPLLLLLAGQNARLAWLLQSLLGIATALLLLALTLRQTRSRTAAIVAAVACGLSLNLIFAEATILTEPLATFLLVLAVFLCTRASVDPDVSVVSYIAVGAVLAFAGLTRPLLLVALPPGLLFLRPWSRPRPLRLTLGFFLPVVMLIGSWCSVVWKTTGTFTLTTLLGYNLTQQSGAFFELLPDEDAQLRDIYLRYRTARIESTGSRSQTIWAAKAEMMSATGLDPVQLSNELTRLSFALFAAHPRLYLKGVRQSWLKFWDPIIMWDLDRFHHPQLRPLVQRMWEAQAKVSRTLKKALLPALIVYLACAMTRRSRRISEAPLLALAIIGSASLVQALIEFGENPRYAIPFQPLIIFVLVAAIFDAASLLRSVLSPQNARAPRRKTDRHWPLPTATISSP